MCMVRATYSSWQKKRNCSSRSFTCQRPTQIAICQPSKRNSTIIRSRTNRWRTSSASLTRRRSRTSRPSECAHLYSLKNTFKTNIFLALDRILCKWPNTYTLTKALAEDLVRSCSADLPIGVFRPAIGKHLHSSLLSDASDWCNKLQLDELSARYAHCRSQQRHSSSSSPSIIAVITKSNFHCSLTIHLAATENTHIHSHELLLLLLRWPTFLTTDFTRSIKIHTSYLFSFYFVVSFS